MCQRRHEGVEFEAKDGTESSTVEGVHSWDPSNPCSQGKTDAKTMMMMMIIFALLFSCTDFLSFSLYISYKLVSFPLLMWFNHARFLANRSFFTLFVTHLHLLVFGLLKGTNLFLISIKSPCNLVQISSAEIPSKELQLLI